MLFRTDDSLQEIYKDEKRWTQFLAVLSSKMYPIPRGQNREESITSFLALCPAATLADLSNFLKLSVAHGEDTAKSAFQRDAVRKAAAQLRRPSSDPVEAQREKREQLAAERLEAEVVAVEAEKLREERLNPQMSFKEYLAKKRR